MLVILVNVFSNVLIPVPKVCAYQNMFIVALVMLIVVKVVKVNPVKVVAIHLLLWSGEGTYYDRKERMTSSKCKFFFFY
jgi:hypothetical protein